MAGVDHALYAAVIPEKDTVYTYATYPDGWVREYTQQRFHEVDPRLLKTREMITPLDWTLLKRDANFARICAAAAPFNLPRNGVTIPVRGPRGDLGLFALSKHCTEAEWTRLLTTRIGNFILHAAQFHESVLSHAIGGEVAPLNETPVLDRREISILTAMARGDTPEETSQRLKIAPRTIETYLRSARLKLRAVTNGHALMRASAFGLLPEGTSQTPSVLP